MTDLSVLDGYISETDLAKQLNRSARTLQRLAARRLGPPRIKVGRLVFYKVDSVRAGSRSRSSRARRPGVSEHPSGVSVTASDIPDSCKHGETQLLSAIPTIG